jgi:hypothetical protein
MGLENIFEVSEESAFLREKTHLGNSRNISEVGVTKTDRSSETISEEFRGTIFKRRRTMFHPRIC